MRSTFVNKLGVSMRFFVPNGTKPQKKEKMYEILYQAIISLINCKSINRVQILIPVGSGSTIDYGKTYKKIITEMIPTMNLTSSQKKSINVIAVSENNELCYGLLNYAVFSQLRTNVTHFISLSPEYFSYINDDTIESILEAFSHKAVVVQPIINELADPILRKGVVDNAFCAWDIAPLVSSGMFANPTKTFGTNEVPFKCGEAVAKIPELSKIYGACVKRIKANGVYNPFDFDEREQIKLKTKLSLEGYEYALKSVNSDSDSLKLAIM